MLKLKLPFHYAQAGGLFRDMLGDYHLISLSAALLGFAASGLAMRIRVQPQVRAAGAR